MKSFLEAFWSTNSLELALEICLFNDQPSPLKNEINYILPKKLAGLIKFLPQDKIEEVHNFFYKKLMSSISVKEFFEKLLQSLKGSPVDKWTGKLNTFFNKNVRPCITCEFNEIFLLDFTDIKSPDFFKQFDDPYKFTGKNTNKILKYLDAQKDAISFEISETKSKVLERIFDDLIDLGKRIDKRQLYAYGPLQRRLDSLARLLSLDSKLSACMALTIHDSKLIISSNVTEKLNPYSQKHYFKTRIGLIRQFLQAVYSGGLKIFKSISEEEYLSFAHLQKGGKLYQISDDTLKSLLRAEFLERISELYAVLKNEANGGLGIPYDLFIKDAYKLAVTTYLIKHDIKHPNDCILSLIDQQFSPKASDSSDTQSPSPSERFGDVNDSSEDSELSPNMTRSSSPELEEIERQEQASCKASLSSYDASEFKEQEIEQAKYSARSLLAELQEIEMQGQASYGASSSSYDASEFREQEIEQAIFSARSSSPELEEIAIQAQNSCAASPSSSELDQMERITPAVSTSSSPTERLLKDCATPTPFSSNVSQAIELRQISKEEFLVLLGDVAKNNIIYLAPMTNSFKKNCVEVAIQYDEKFEQIPIHLKENLKLKGIHAEQLIMIAYLQHFLHLDLTDAILPKVHIGVSKLACKTCDELKSAFPMIVLTGGSHLSFPEVMNMGAQCQAADIMGMTPEAQLQSFSQVDESIDMTLEESSPSSSQASQNIGELSLLSKRKKPAPQESSMTSSSKLGISSGPYSPFFSPGAKKACDHHISVVRCNKKLEFEDDVDQSSSQKNSLP